ncbi:HGxxPAAW family protein [Streptomyces sp. NBC_00299]|uniref:HGxxPAAW family protein n=1 Tax=Streptomyces sp. NBC_00299 TaxID=2975705 RepID=UPI002E29C03E|nr:HGxxPAAW family protein [Streptomyces sp. NBC_00299]
MSQYDEGHTVAGWTGTAIATIGSAVVGAGICTVSAVLITGGLGITAASVLVTWALHLTGWGKPPGVRPRDQWRMGARDLSARAGHADCWGCRLAGRALERGRGRGLERGTAAATSEAVTVTGEQEPAVAEAR